MGDDRDDVAPDADGDPGRDLADLVDDLEEKVLTETGDPREKIARDGDGSGVDRDGDDAEPPV